MLHRALLATKLKPYIGQVATRTIVPDFINAANVQARSRRGFFTRTGFSNAVIRFPNFYVKGFANSSPTYQELGPGAAATITAALEYPSGVFTQITFGGVASGSIPNASYLDCDPVPVAVPAGALFYVRMFVTCPSGVCVNLGVTISAGSGSPGNGAFMGDAFDAAASGITDNTMGGAYTSTTTTSAMGPMLILAKTTAPSVIIYGDSISYGENDQGDASGDVGSAARSVGGVFNYASYSIRGDAIAGWLTKGTLRKGVLPYFSHVIIQLGVNDYIQLARTPAQLATDTTSMLAAMGGKPTAICTLLPGASSTDNYATTVNQTPLTWNANRVTENQRRRSAPGFFANYDLAAGIENSQDDGLIKPGLGYMQTSTGSVHPRQPGYLAIKNSGVLNPASIKRKK